MKILGIVALVLLVLLLGGCAWLYTPDLPRQALEARYAPPPSQFRTIAGIRLHLRDTGPRDAPAILLLHGFASSLHTWEAWAEALAPTHRVIRFDLPGFGLTGPDPLGDYTDPRAIAIIAALLDDLGLARATVIGNSMGGRIAWRFAAAHPERVEKLVLISPDGFASFGIVYDTPVKVPTLLRLLPYVMPRPLLRMNIAPSYGDPARLSDETVNRYGDLMLVPGVRRAIVTRLEQHILPDPRPLLRGITAPTLLLWGERDGLIPFANAQDYLGELPNAQLAPLPTLGHVPFEEDPALSLPPLRAFLNTR